MSIDVIIADTPEEAKLSIVHWLESYARETMANGKTMRTPQRRIALARGEQLHEVALRLRAMPVRGLMASLETQEPLS